VKIISKYLQSKWKRPNNQNIMIQSKKERSIAKKKNCPNPKLYMKR